MTAGVTPVKTKANQIKIEAVPTPHRVSPDPFSPYPSKIAFIRTPQLNF
jgi:hypothetical protein